MSDKNDYHMILDEITPCAVTGPEHYTWRNLRLATWGMNDQEWDEVFLALEADYDGPTESETYDKVWDLS